MIQSSRALAGAWPSHLCLSTWRPDMKILAIDLGKFKSTACVFEAAIGKHAFTTIRTVVAEMHDLLALHQPDRVVIEIGSRRGGGKKLPRRWEWGGEGDDHTP